MCSEWLGACPATAPTDVPAPKGGAECAACRALGDDASMLLRRSAYRPGYDYYSEKQASPVFRYH